MWRWQHYHAGTQVHGYWDTGRAGVCAERGQLGFKTNLDDLYDVMKEIGRGANGVVTRVHHKASGRLFACKTIPKVPSAGLSAEKQLDHLSNIRREISVMKELSSCLNVAKLEDVFEDQAHVHIVQELCLGGELEHSIGRTHYSERTVRPPLPPLARFWHA